MAEQPPESVVVGAYVGIKNAVTRERLKPTELCRATNVDVDNEGQLRRRQGYTLRAEGDYHSLKTVPSGRTFVVRNGSLGLLVPDMTHTPLADGGADPISYADVAGTAYYSSRSVSGKILPDNTVLPWGETGGAGEWLSPVIRPTETLGPVAGKLLGRPPLAEHICHMGGRIFLAEESVLWATELYLYDYVDRTRTFMQFESRITGLAHSADGLYVGTETGVWFLRGPLGSMERSVVVKKRLIPGSMVEVAGDFALVAGEPAMQYRNAVLFMTDDGLIAGFNGGFCRNITANETIFPNAASVVPLFRTVEGMNQYLAVATMGGTPVARARVGDYAEAEIRRAEP